MLTKIVEFLGLAFWVEVVTDNPKCTYYFGPFLSAKEAESTKGGYIEDLENEGAQGIVVTVKRCKPSNLTIFDEDLGESINGKLMPKLSGQLS